MSVNQIKIKIEGQLKNQTNYVWNNARLIYIDTLKLTELSSQQKVIINDLKTELESLEDPWTYLGIPDRAKTENVLNNLNKLKLVLKKFYL
ncbi:hypothetical protein H1R17_00510 [Flavobacterium sp. xlx-214]|uniref:hypothetical protein n=1 Tax=unclassified Flavobacterium TaxID=196869 RepID=UPI0013D802BF|nr:MULTISPECIES: hypothetical protein [unclassified Flavobacterium]MBA5791167.1 hypothetical protein [Flavobacterium sp. xlx-221]QMI83663.1 hypothetical protein H1R17_00510 [Flavobacterium sp. xlx-214]